MSRHDTRTFYKNEQVHITDGYFKNGTYKGSVANMEGVITTHIITSIRNGITFPDRWVDSSHVIKFIASPIHLKHIYVELVKGGSCLAEWASQQGY